MPWPLTVWLSGMVAVWIGGSILQGYWGNKADEGAGPTVVMVGITWPLVFAVGIPIFCGRQLGILLMKLGSALAQRKQAKELSTAAALYRDPPPLPCPTCGRFLPEKQP